jgi:subtilisin family serine protease
MSPVAFQLYLGSAGSRMHLCFKTYAILLVLLSLAGFSISQTAQKTRVPDEILVKFSKGTDPSNIKKAHRALGASVIEHLGDLGWERIKIPAGMDVDEAIKRYAGVASVEAVQPNYYYQLQVTPNDPQFASSGMYGLSKISAPLAWNLTTGSSTVVVADIDTGMRYTHEDLAANAWVNLGEVPDNGVDDDGNGFIDDYHGYDFRFNDPDPWDEHGHGTHTAGTIGAVGNNLLGVVGVNWNVKIMPIKIYSSTGLDSTSAMLVNAYNYVRMMKNRGVNIRVTNNSYGGCPEQCSFDKATKDALDALGEAGVLNVFAAGNDSADNDITPSYPVSYDLPSILGVASSTSTDDKASSSSYGRNTVDLAAPGSGILSTTFDSDTSYGPKSGTSMAAPHVAGAAALLSAYNPLLSAASLKATLMNTADPLTGWSATPTKTNGRLNVANALQNPTVCDFALSGNAFQVLRKGGVFTITVTAPANCDFSTKTGVSWIHVLGSSGVFSGNSDVTLRVSLGPPFGRSGTLKIAGHDVTINQGH